MLRFLLKSFVPEILKGIFFSVKCQNLGMTTYMAHLLIIARSDPRLICFQLEILHNQKFQYETEDVPHRMKTHLLIIFFRFQHANFASGIIKGC